ncbi:ferric reductase NAD binding domain-containing protein [Boletus edulis BED1]|uniref:ferric-chelate reductase (NADPH) n=1 Tax=Boletus edulis BED1 TaxID=1328754 RepID=A0AAD4BQ09_BOLED|nr:ferric reductase NAD binding domain-containing protein [Boletus edulis BED1]
MASPPPSLPSLTLSTTVEAWIALSTFFVVVGISQWSSVLYSKVVKQHRPPRDPDEESTHTSIARPRANSGGWSLARLPLAAVNVFRVVAFRWTLEFGTYDLRVVDVFLTLAYIALLFGLTFEGVADFGVTRFNLRYWSGGAGRLAASQLPLVAVLGTKHNILSFITGIGYEKLNYFHRVTARSCFVLLLFHAGGQIYSSNRYSHHEPFFRLGLTAIVSLTILSIVSLRGIRNKAYEVFFYTHFITVFIFLIGAYFHTRYPAISFSSWIWPTFMFWAIDRFMRLARIVVYNHLYFAFSWRAKVHDATTELLSDDFIRVRVRRPAHLQWSPGQTAFLIMPSVSTFPLEAHPFSIMSVDSPSFRDGVIKHPARNGEIEETAEAVYDKELVFLINVRGGFTNRLKKVAAQNGTVKVFIDGPYGRAPDIGAYDTSILIAGGSGITYILPVFLDAIEEARKGSIQCRRLVFIWAVRDTSHVQWISDALYRANALTPTWLTVSIRIFVTRGGLPFSEDSIDPELTPDKESAHLWVIPPSVRMEYGRPDLKATLRGEVSTAIGSMSVTVCGSQSLTRSVRRALRFPVSGPYSILSGGPSVTLHTESFGYA